MRQAATKARAELDEARSTKVVYLDHHATTPVDPRVFDAMRPYFTERFGNAASIGHAFGTEAANAVEQGREQVAALLGCSPRALIFTSGATESNNLAIKGALRAAPAGSHLIVSAAEHRAVLDPARRLEREGFELTIVPVDECGSVDVQRVADAIGPRTVLVSVMLVNNEVGTINPLAEIGELCRRRGVLLHCDAAQAVGRIPVRLDELPVDLLSASAHKLYGPKGVGALYVRRSGPRVRLEPLIDGGGHEQRLRSGTLPVPLIAGFGTAAELAAGVMPEESRRLAELTERLWLRLSRQTADCTVNGHPTRRVPGNLNVGFHGVDGDALLAGLKGIAVSSGSACTSADPEPSHVLRAMGVPETLARASLRFGIGRFNTAEEIDFAADYVAAAVERLRRLAR
jgi:cysteine desulfurase